MCSFWCHVVRGVPYGRKSGLRRDFVWNSLKDEPHFMSGGGNVTFLNFFKMPYLNFYWVLEHVLTIFEQLGACPILF